MKKLWLLAVLILLISACKKDNDEEPAPTSNTLSVQLTFNHDGTPLMFDTIMFQQAAGYQMSITRLQFYISNIRLIKEDSTLVDISDYQYVDARDGTTHSFKLTLPETGHYIGLKLEVGLDSAHNITDALPAQTIHQNMAWPEMMGGGYHFMKFEGQYVDSTGTYGYAMHVGTNPYLVNCVVPDHFNLTAGTNSLVLAMNVNEWFKNPALYDFNIDGNYSMGVMAAMMKLKQNGTDIFTKQ